LNRSDAQPIHDLRIEPLSVVEDGRSRVWTAMTAANSWLRRFGLAEVHHVSDGASASCRIRRKADEVWALLEGQAAFRWVDLRDGSPTKGKVHRWEADSPTLVLAPFGVAFSVEGHGAWLLRLATHSEEEDPPAEYRETPGGA
jgi:dTDP-4-dehydrorhamnose 3,5-epimerase-like enzyme